MNDKLNVLFLGGAKRVSLAEHLIDTARRKGLDVEVYSYELDEFVPIASVGTVILGLRWKDENIIPDLLSVIREKDIHIVLPFVDPAVEIALEEAAAFFAGDQTAEDTASVIQSRVSIYLGEQS